MKGYDDNPDATAAAIRDGWFHTGDLGYLDREGYLVLTGRMKELIVTSGGKNIHPEELEALYLASPAIAEICLVGTMRTSEGGEGLHAVVVPNFEQIKARVITGVRQLIKDELTRIGLTLPPYKRITGLSVVKEPLPRTRLGKIQRHRVAARLLIEDTQRAARRSLTETDRALLETDVARSVMAALSALLPKRTEISLEDHLDLDLGMDSLRRVELVVALEERIGPLPETFAGEVVTVRDVIEKLKVFVPGPGEETPGPRSMDDILMAAPPAELADELLGSRPVPHQVAAAFARTVLRLALRSVFRLRVSGMERIPQEGPFVLAPNHVSHADPFVVLAAVHSEVFARLFTLGWQPYFRGPISSWVARAGHLIPVGMDAPLVTALQAAAAVLRQGQGLLIFPEGQRSLDGRLQPFKKGIGVLACKLGVPVIPVWIEGTFEVLPAGARWPRIHAIGLHLGEQVTITSDLIARWRREGGDPYEASTMMIREAVLRLAQEPKDGKHTCTAA